MHKQGVRLPAVNLIQRSNRLPAENRGAPGSITAKSPRPVVGVFPAFLLPSLLGGWFTLLLYFKKDGSKPREQSKPVQVYTGTGVRLNSCQETKLSAKLPSPLQSAIPKAKGLARYFSLEIESCAGVA